MGQEGGYERSCWHKVLQEVGGHGVMDTGGWLGLTKGKKMTTGPRSNLRKVVRTVSKFAKRQQ